MIADTIGVNVLFGVADGIVIDLDGVDTYSVFALYASGMEAVMGGMLVLGLAYIIWGFLAPRFAAGNASAVKA